MGGQVSAISHLLHHGQEKTAGGASIPLEERLEVMRHSRAIRLAVSNCGSIAS